MAWGYAAPWTGDWCQCPLDGYYRLGAVRLRARLLGFGWCALGIAPFFGNEQDPGTNDRAGDKI